MNGPTSRRLAVGSARRTSKPPMSLALGMTISLDRIAGEGVAGQTGRCRERSSWDQLTQTG